MIPLWENSLNFHLRNRLKMQVIGSVQHREFCNILKKLA